MRALVLAALLLVAAPAQAACKLALALALDISSSVNAREYAIQLGGLVEAFRTDAVQEAILSPPGASAAVMAFEWSGARQQAVIAGWTILDSPAAIEGFADRLSRHRRVVNDQATAVGEALAFAADRLAEAPPCGRHVIDISGDGENNDGRGVAFFKRQGKLEGITINALVIQGAYPNPAIFYRGEVMQGPDAFVALARDFTDYPAVMIGKLIREMGTDLMLGELR